MLTKKQLVKYLFVAERPNIGTCFDWFFPLISELCPPLYTDEKTKVRCYDQQKLEIKCSEASDGSFVQVECAPYYELTDARIRFCYQGRWTSPPPQCIPGQPPVIIILNINIYPNCTSNCIFNVVNKTITPNQLKEIPTSDDFDSIIFPEDER